MRIFAATKLQEMNIDIYLNMSSVPAGAILNRIAQQEHLHQTTLAQKTGLIPQRINDLIMGRRRFTPQNSFALEQALGISLPGFFYKIQSNHDIYQAQLADNQLKPDISLLSQTTFWDVDLSKIEWMKCRDWAISRVLEYGTKEEIEELHRFYGHQAFSKIKENPKRFMLYDVALKNLKIVGL
jgi:plasmid maintenance system antidote protein VapI